MKIKKYNVLYQTIYKSSHTTCTSKSLINLIENFMEDEDAQALLVIIPENEVLKEKQEQVDKKKYYDSKYASFHRKYKNKMISEAEFKDIVIMLKEYKKTSKTKKEFEENLQKYLNKKNTNNISGNIVSE